MPQNYLEAFLQTSEVPLSHESRVLAVTQQLNIRRFGRRSLRAKTPHGATRPLGRQYDRVLGVDNVLGHYLEDTRKNSGLSGALSARFQKCGKEPLVLVVEVVDYVCCEHLHACIARVQKV